ncbi:UNVERIFIED_CONTAM: hypothetical protein LK11_03245 [Mumia flava]
MRTVVSAAVGATSPLGPASGVEATARRASAMPQHVQGLAPAWRTHCDQRESGADTPAPVVTTARDSPTPNQPRYAGSHCGARNRLSGASPARPRSHATLIRTIAAATPWSARGCHPRRQTTLTANHPSSGRIR